jgi:hypothetical protein
VEKTKRGKLEAAGWRVGSAEEFLELSAEEAAFVDLKLALSTELRDRRSASGLTQVELARKMGSSQSRVAKMEASDPEVTVDLLIKGLLATGASRRDIAKAVARPRRRRTRTGKTATPANNR